MAAGSSIVSAKMRCRQAAASASVNGRRLASRVRAWSVREQVKGLISPSAYVIPRARTREGRPPSRRRRLPITSDKITGFYGIDRIVLILNPVNHDNPVILSKKHGSYPHLHSRAKRGRRANWENGRLVRCMGRTWTVHGTDETSVVPVKAPRGLWPHWRRGKRLLGVHLSGL